MSRISDNLSVLVDAKGAIAAAIEAKGGTVTGGLTNYASAIRAIPGGVEFPEGTKFAYSTWSEIPAAVKSYVVDLQDWQSIFYGCTGLTSISLNTSIGYQFSNAFVGCRNLQSVNFVATQNYWHPMSFYNTFYNCTSLQEVNLVAPYADDIQGCFRSCSTLTAISLDLPNVRLALSCFNQCSKLVDVTLNIPNVTSLYYCFASCINLTTISLDVPEATSLECCFLGCTRLKSISFTKLSNITGMGYNSFISRCSALEDFYVEELSNQCDWVFTPSTKLTHDSLMNIINALIPTSSKKCYLGVTNLAKLTDDEIAIATNKGWTLT